MNDYQKMLNQIQSDPLLGLLSVVVDDIVKKQSQQEKINALIHSSLQAQKEQIESLAHNVSMLSDALMRVVSSIQQSKPSVVQTSWRGIEIK